MTILEAIKKRHSVREYTDEIISKEVAEELQEFIDLCNQESGLNFQLGLEDPSAFDSKIFNYGIIKNARNFIALVGPKKGSDEKIGYYGEKIVLKAQQLGLNTCWLGLTYSKSKTNVIINKGEKLRLLIALGYGANQGHPHKSKDIKQLCKVDRKMPKWFEDGMKAAMLAPTSINQQKFLFVLKNNKVYAKALKGFYSKVDLGIVIYHFEIGAKKGKFDFNKK